MKRSARLTLIVSLALAPALLTAAAGGKEPEKKWEKLFDGKTMKGWRLMAVHGGHGGVWVVEKGALVGDREPDFKGGLIATERKYANYEIETEFKADFPADSGLFLRTDDQGGGYQVTIDYRPDGTIGSLYSGGYMQKYDDWEKHYKKDAWNRLRVRIEGAPAHIQIWLNEVKTVDFTDASNKYPAQGYIGMQVHGGQKAWGDNSRARFQKIRIKELGP